MADAETDDPFAILGKFAAERSIDVPVEDAEARCIRASIIGARMRGNPSYQEMEDYALACNCFNPHPCDTKCPWESLERNRPFTDPSTGKTHKLATGRVYVCRISGRTHICDGNDCAVWSRIDSNGSMACGISSIEIGQTIVIASSTASRKQIRDAMVATIAPTNTILTKRKAGTAKSGAPPDRQRRA